MDPSDMSAWMLVTLAAYFFGLAVLIVACLVAWREEPPLVDSAAKPRPPAPEPVPYASAKYSRIRRIDPDLIRRARVSATLRRGLAPHGAWARWYVTHAHHPGKHA